MYYFRVYQSGILPQLDTSTLGIYADTSIINSLVPIVNLEFNSPDFRKVASGISGLFNPAATYGQFFQINGEGLYGDIYMDGMLKVSVNPNSPSNCGLGSYFFFTFC